MLGKYDFREIHFVEKKSANKLYTFKINFFSSENPRHWPTTAAGHRQWAKHSKAGDEQTKPLLGKTSCPLLLRGKRHSPTLAATPCSQPRPSPQAVTARERLHPRSRRAAAARPRAPAAAGNTRNARRPQALRPAHPALPAGGRHNTRTPQPPQRAPGSPQTSLRVHTDTYTRAHAQLQIHAATYTGVTHTRARAPFSLALRIAR